MFGADEKAGLFIWLEGPQLTQKLISASRAIRHLRVRTQAGEGSKKSCLLEREVGASDKGQALESHWHL